MDRVASREAVLSSLWHSLEVLLTKSDAIRQRVADGHLSVQVRPGFQRSNIEESGPLENEQAWGNTSA